VLIANLPFPAPAPPHDPDVEHGAQLVFANEVGRAASPVGSIRFVAHSGRDVAATFAAPNRYNSAGAVMNFHHPFELRDEDGLQNF
jgi:hypothetical protein